MSETAFHLLDEPLIPLHLEAAYLCISCQLSASTTLCILVRFKELNPLNCGQWRQVSRSLSGGTERQDREAEQSAERWVWLSGLSVWTLTELCPHGSCFKNTHDCWLWEWTLCTFMLIL